MMSIIFLILIAIVCLVLTVYLAVSLYIKIYNWHTRRKKRKVEYSKLIFALVAGLNIGVIIYSLVMMAITRDLTPLAYIIPATAADMATATGFYYWKARAENKIKLKKKYDIPLSEDDLDDGTEQED